MHRTERGEAVIEIPLTNGGVAFVDEQDHDTLSRFSWRRWESYPGIVYAMTRPIPGGKNVLMHKMILPGRGGLDHKDGNGLNNTRGNLRPANQSQNSANRRVHKNNKSGFKGVRRIRSSINNPWAASVKYNGKQFHLGLFPTKEDAALAYDIAAVSVFGEFARTNIL